MKHSIQKNSPEKPNRSTGKTPAKYPKPRSNKRKEQHPKHSACRVQPRRQCRALPRSVSSASNQAWSEASPVTMNHTSLSTFNGHFVTFVRENGVYGIYVHNSGEVEDKNKVFLYRYPSLIPEDTSGEGLKYEVKLRLKENKNFWLHADNQKCSVEVKEFGESEMPLPEQTSFLLHYKTSEYVSFECKSNRGTFIAVSGGQLKLVQQNDLPDDKTLFKLHHSV